MGGGVRTRNTNPYFANPNPANLKPANPRKQVFGQQHRVTPGERASLEGPPEGGGDWGQFASEEGLEGGAGSKLKASKPFSGGGGGGAGGGGGGFEASVGPDGQAGPGGERTMFVYEPFLRLFSYTHTCPPAFLLPRTLLPLSGCVSPGPCPGAVLPHVTHPARSGCSREVRLPLRSEWCFALAH